MSGANLHQRCGNGFIAQRAHRARDLIGRQRLPFVGVSGIGHRHRRHQLAGVGVLRVVEHRLPRADFHDLPEVHHRHPVADALHHRHVV
ncbi:hypothetical protein AK51_26400 [Serratia nematodiphila DZ0503SBS1]|nr:hypothetical protein AK51_26400 [Serratia nematodiphila DZ0503SBS1]